MRWLVLLLVLLRGLAAQAHDADVIYVLVKQGPQPEILEERVTLTAATLAFLAPLDADGDGLLSQGDLDARNKALRAGFWDEAPLTAEGQACALLETKAWLREGFVELQAELRCGEGELRQDFKILRVLPANYRVVLGSQLDGEGQGRGFAQGSLTTIPVPRPPAPGSWDAGAYRRALHQGIQKGLAPEVLAALFALMLALGAWRKGLVAAGLVLAAVAAGSFAPLDWWPPSVLLLLIAAACAWRLPPRVVPLLLGAAIGAREGGGGWSVGVGLAAGTLLVLVFASPVALALGVMAQRRPRVLKVVRWAPMLVVVAAMAGRARLSW